MSQHEGADVLVDTDALWRDYFANPFSADKKYLNRRFAIELRPFQIARLQDGSPIFLYRAGARRTSAVLFQASNSTRLPCCEESTPRSYTGRV